MKRPRLGAARRDPDRALHRLNIPFVIYSGYSKLEGACSKGELIEKPASTHTLVIAILDALTQRHRPSIN